MLRLFSLPDRESPGIRRQMTARSVRTFRAKAEIVFLRQEMGSGRANRKPPIPQAATQRQNVSCCEASATGICGGSGCASDPKGDPLLSTFPSVIFSFLGKNCKFQGFWWANFPLYEKMRRTKGQRWDKVGLSRMRDEVGSRLTIGQGSKCIKCERNDNMGDRAIHNLLIILKCLLEEYKIDN